MKVLTVQSKNIDLSKDIIYPKPDKKKTKVYLDYPVYNKMKDILSNQIHKDVDYVFWGFSNIEETFPNLEYNNELCIFSLLSKIGIYKNKKFNKKYILLELEIPTVYEYVETDFYDYCSILFDQQEGIVEEDEFPSVDHANYDRTRQVILPYIKKEWITRVVTNIDESLQSRLNSKISMLYAGYAYEYERSNSELYKEMRDALSNILNIANKISKEYKIKCEEYSIEEYNAMKKEESKLINKIKKLFWRIIHE